MADGFNIHIFKEPWDEMQAQIGTVTERATMYALRELGRTYRAAAKAQAPRYSGTDPRVDRGALRRSIKSSRQVRRGGGTFEMRVMPQGRVTRPDGKAARGVPLYRRQMEDQFGYMGAGRDATMTRVREVYDAAYKRAWARWGPA